MQEFKTLHFSKGGDVAVIVLNRPERLNAINKQMLLDLNQVVNHIERDKEVRFVTVTGAGRAFCAGGDLAEFKKCDSKDARSRSNLAQKFLTRIETSSKIYIAKINGHCIGGGLEIAMACDFRIAEKKAMFGQPETKIGIITGYGGSVRLPRIVGYDFAKHLLLTGELITAEKAWNMALIGQVASSQKQLETKAKTLIDSLRANAPTTAGAIKKLLYNNQNISAEKALNAERKEFAARFGTKEQKEGMNAFLEKRKPKWHTL